MVGKIFVWRDRLVRRSARPAAGSLAGADGRLRGHHMVDPAVPLRRIAII